MITYLDACPGCPPGIPDASAPVGPVAEDGYGTVADYQCGTCGNAWSTYWDRYGWPVDRNIAPVSPEQAERNRARLEDGTRQARRAA